MSNCTFLWEFFSNIFIGIVWNPWQKLKIMLATCTYIVLYSKHICSTINASFPDSWLKSSFSQIAYPFHVYFGDIWWQTFYWIFIVVYLLGHYFQKKGVIWHHLIFFETHGWRTMMKIQNNSQNVATWNRYKQSQKSSTLENYRKNHCYKCQSIYDIPKCWCVFGQELSFRYIPFILKSGRREDAFAHLNLWTRITSDFGIAMDVTTQYIVYPISYNIHT